MEYSAAGIPQSEYKVTCAAPDEIPSTMVTDFSDDLGEHFRKARASLEEAERLNTVEPLNVAMKCIGRLVELIQAQNAEADILDSAQASARGVLELLRMREDPVDTFAAARLRKSISRFGDPISFLNRDELTRLFDELYRLLAAADQARSTWIKADLASHAAPFDRALRPQCSDSLDIYQQAEDDLADFLSAKSLDKAPQVEEEPVDEPASSIFATTLPSPKFSLCATLKPADSRGIWLEKFLWCPCKALASRLRL